MYFIYHRGEEFVGLTPFPWVSVEGLSVLEIAGDIPDLNRVVWDGQLMQLVKSVPTLSKLDFMSRFTATERISIQSSVDPIIKDAMSLVQMAEYVDVTDQRTMQLVGYLAMTGLILNTRVAEILA